MHKAWKDTTEKQYPSRPGFLGQYIFFSPNLFAAKAVVSPMQATDLSQFSDFAMRLTQALYEEKKNQNFQQIVPEFKTRVQAM